MAPGAAPTGPTPTNLVDPQGRGDPGRAEMRAWRSWATRPLRAVVGAARQPRRRSIVRAKRAAVASRATCRPPAATVRPDTITSRTAEAPDTNT